MAIDENIKPEEVRASRFLPRSPTHPGFKNCDRFRVEDTCAISRSSATASRLLTIFLIGRLYNANDASAENSAAARSPARNLG
jgi:hypothetical protein